MRRFGPAAALVALWGCAGIGGEAALARIGRLEDDRSPDVVRFASSTEPEVRARAAVALGRLLRPEGVDPLLGLLRDENLAVRRAALFGLGQFGFQPCGREREILERIKPLLRDEFEVMRALAAEAVGKLAGAGAPSLVAPLLDDSAPNVRAEAALACFRWRQVMRMQKPGEDPPALPAVVVESLLEVLNDLEVEVRWRAAYVFSRVPEPRVTGSLGGLLQDAHPWVRLFSIRGLVIAKAQEAAELIAGCCGDAELAVRVEAASALAALERPELIPEALARDASFHVRAAAAVRHWEALMSDESPEVRAAALRGTDKAAKAESKARLISAAKDAHWVVREEAARLSGQLGEEGLGVLESCEQDGDERVRAAAVEAAAAIEGPVAFRMITRALASESLALRGAAVEALGGRKEEERLTLVIQAYAKSLEARWTEVREMVVDLVAKVRTDQTTAFLELVVREDAAPSVRDRAAKALGRSAASPAAVAVSRTPHADLRFSGNPVVALETDRGTIVIECLAAKAPVHVANFVGLVKAGFYDGLLFHRVVSNFVIQGGDPQGAGWGDAGYAMRAEINLARFDRGTLGMPRSAGFDTGGCQLFITHVPTPHLDGLYTVFGQVRKGLEVVDLIQRGDRIIRAHVMSHP